MSYEQVQAEHLYFRAELDQIALQEAKDVEIKQLFGSFVGSMTHRKQLPIKKLAIFVSLYYIRRLLIVTFILRYFYSPPRQIIIVLLLQLVYLAFLIELKPNAS